MSFTYAMDPASPRDTIRALLGDTDPTLVEVQDEEIDLFVAIAGAASMATVSIYRAAMMTAQRAAANYARSMQYSVDQGLTASPQQKFEHYTALVAQFQTMMAFAPVSPYVGGLSVADKRARQIDTSKVQPIFRRDMDSEPGTIGDTANTLQGQIPGPVN